LVFHSSTIAMMHGPINIRFSYKVDEIVIGTAFPLSDGVPSDYCSILCIAL